MYAYIFYKSYSCLLEAYIASALSYMCANIYMNINKHIYLLISKNHLELSNGSRVRACLSVQFVQ